MPPNVSTFAFTCSLAALAVNRSQHAAARIPGTLFAIIADANALPSTMMPV